MTRPPIKTRSSWWIARALLWSFTGCVLGPVIALLPVRAYAVLTSQESPASALVGGTVGLLMYAMIAFVFGLPVFTPILIAWAWLAPRYPRIESPSFIVGASLCIALGASVAVAISYACMQEPFGARGGDLAAISGMVGLVVAAGLLTPRCIIPLLRPGRMLDTRAPII